MLIDLKDIADYQDLFGIHDLCSMKTNDYHKALESGAFIWIDHHDHVRSTFSDEIIATNQEQVDALIQKLKGFRDRMAKTPEWVDKN